jgi:sugar lactone lactonase YvrE
MRATMRAFAVPGLAAVLALSASCGVGGAGIALGLGGGGGGGGGPAPPPPPNVTVAAPPGQANANLVRFQYVLRDPQVTPIRDENGQIVDPGGVDDPRVRIRAEWQIAEPGIDTEVWFEMSEAVVPESDGTRALSLGQHSFVWNTLPDLAGYVGRFRVRIRVTAEYEETAGFRRTFRTRPATMTIDNRLAGTVFGVEVQPPSDVDTFPVDLRPDGDGFVVADFGANIVERVDTNGLVSRLLGFGVPGDTIGTGRSPGVARLQTLIGVELDAAGNLYTNHSTSLVVTNQGAVPISFGATTVPPYTVVRGATGLQSSRDVRFHPSGALLFLDQGTTLLAFNPQDPANPGSTPIVLAGVAVAPGAAEAIAGGGASTDDGVPATTAQIADAIGVAVGPDGEIYYVERGAARVRVVNPGTTDLVVGAATVAPGTVVTVAGTGTPGSAGDEGPATAAQLSLPGAIDVNAQRGLFIADTGNARVRMVNLGAAPMTFAETTVGQGQIDTVVGGGSGGVGSKALDLQFAIPNALSLDADGNLLVADERTVIFVNGGTTSITSYGKTAGPARTARVYDANRRAGAPLTEPRTIHSDAPTEVFVTDRATVRVMNLATTPRVFGGEAALPGEVVVVGGGSVPGFGGDGGSARSAAFAFPSGLAKDGPRRLYVADTGNDRVRMINLGDPRLPTTESETVLGQTVAPGGVATVIGGASAPLFQDGDGGPAGSCSLLGPEAVAVSGDGLIWIADTGHHRIRVVNTGLDPVTIAGVTVGPGSIGTVVGNGTAGSTPDGAGPWLTSSPSALAIDNQGVVYFAERGNSRIRCLNPSAAGVVRAGIAIGPDEVRTLVGTGVAGNSGDGGEGPAAQIASPRALFVQSRSDNLPVVLYFSDEVAHVVRVLNLTSDEDLPLAIDAERRVIVTIPAASVATVAGGPNTPGVPNFPADSGDGEEAARVRFNSPFGIAVTTAAGVNAHFFVADRGNDRLRRFAAPLLATPQR